MTTVRCNSCGQVFRCTPFIPTRPISALDAFSGFGGDLSQQLGSLFGGIGSGLQGLGAQQAFASNMAAQIFGPGSRGYRLDVIEPGEPDDIREWRREWWSKGHYA